MMKGIFFGIYFIFLLSILCIRFSNTINSKNVDTLKCRLSGKLIKEIDSYKPILKKIYMAATKGFFRKGTINELETFVNIFSHRLSGSRVLEKSIDFMLNKLKHENLENVHGEDVMVPRWVRGKESVQILKPILKEMRMLGLGYSVRTPKEGIMANAIVIKSFNELQERAEDIPGKIVIFNQNYTTYGNTVKYREYRALEAAKYGAVAVLIRSIAPVSLGFPHTGMMKYEINGTKIPAACITIEDAQFLDEMSGQGKTIEIRLKMEAKTYPSILSRNVISEIIGNLKPEKVVIVSGHIDNWDVGQGAMDDGGGAFISWNALVLLKKLGLYPSRTIRSILWTAEEVGCVGSLQYIKTHKFEKQDFQFVMESDSGMFTPLGLRVSGSNIVKCIIRKILSLTRFTI